MDPLKVILESGTPRELPIPTTSQPTHVVFWKEQKRGPDHFWQFYTLHALRLRIHSLNQPYFEIYTQYKPLEKVDDAYADGIGGLIKTKEVGTIFLDL